jgi:ribosomal 50S subunit-recycling heat shock protein
MTELVVLAEDASGKPRLDTFISDKLPELSRSRVQKLIEQGQVLVNGDIARAGLKLRAGDIIAITIPQPEPLDAVAEDIPLDIVYEDEHLLVINKPAGMVTHPGAGVNNGTLVNAVLHHAAGSLSSIGGVGQTRDCAPPRQRHKRAYHGGQRRSHPYRTVSPAQTKDSKTLLPSPGRGQTCRRERHNQSAPGAPPHQAQRNDSDAPRYTGHLPRGNHSLQSRQTL